MVVDFIAKATGKTPAREEFEGLTWGLYQFGKTITAAQYQLCWASLQGLSRQVAAWQQAYDAWITPVLATPPMKIGTINLEETDLMKGWAPIVGLRSIHGAAKHYRPAGYQPAARLVESRACRSAYNLSAASAKSTCCSSLRRRSRRLSPGARSGRRFTAD